MHLLDGILLVMLVLGNLFAIPLWWRFFGRPLTWAWRLSFRSTEGTAVQAPELETGESQVNRLCHLFS